MKKVLIVGISLLSIGVISLQQAYAQAEEEKKVNKDELIGYTKNVEGIAITDTSEGWDIGGVVTINFSNVGLKNWASGGSNSYSATGLFGLHANLLKGNSTWDNNLDLGLGAIKQFTPGQDASQIPFIKSDDKIDFTSKYGQKASKSWFYSGLLNFKSQFLPGYADPYALKDSLAIISNFLSPGYGIAAIGMDYKPNKELTAFIAPVTAKATIVMDDDLNAVGAFGVDSNQTLRMEYGLYFRVMYTKEVVKNVTFSSKFEWFQNYQRFEHIDINWETLTSMKVNEYISATFSTHLIYDDDIDIAHDFDENGVAQKNGPVVQFKHVLGIGITYKF